MGQKKFKSSLKKKLFNPIKSNFSQTCKDDVPPHILPSRQNTILLGAACAKPQGMSHNQSQPSISPLPYTQNATLLCSQKCQDLFLTSGTKTSLRGEGSSGKAFLLPGKEESLK